LSPACVLCSQNTLGLPPKNWGAGQNPVHWENYYSGDEEEQNFARKYSYSDRSRYYWPNPKVKPSLKTLLRNLGDPAIADIIGKSVFTHAE